VRSPVQQRECGFGGLAPAAGPSPVRLLAPNPGALTLEGTNTWVAHGLTGVIVIDPGPADPRHLAAIVQRGPIAAVLLTHGHADHAAALTELSPRIPVYAAVPFPDAGVRPIGDGDLLDLAGVGFRVLATPGHTSDSVCILMRAESGPFLFTGDTLLGGLNASLLPTSPAALSDYLGSLEVLSELDGVRGCPGHGPEIVDVGVHAQRALEHRYARLERIRELLRRGCLRDPDALARAQYPHRPERQALAARMIAAELAYLGH